MPSICAHYYKTATPAWQAAYDGDVGKLQSLLSHGVDVYELTPGAYGCKCTPLHVAAYRGHTNIVQVLLSDATRFHAPGIQIGHHPAVYVTDSAGIPALHYAMRGLHIEVAKLLLANGANANPGMHLCARICCESPPVLIASKAKFSGYNQCFRGQDSSGTVREWADRRVDMMRLLFSHGALLPAPEYMNASFTIWEIATGHNHHGEDEEPHTGMLELLIEYDRHTNRIPLPGEFSPVHMVACLDYYASMHGADLALLSVLVKNGYNLEGRDFSGRTPMHIANSMKKSKFVEILLDAGVNLFDDQLEPESSRWTAEIAALIENRQSIQRWEAFAIGQHVPLDIAARIFTEHDGTDYNPYFPHMRSQTPPLEDIDSSD
jgi:ankyrin repeat protein